MARAIPVCAITARRQTCALLSMASVATTAGVVLWSADDVAAARHGGCRADPAFEVDRGRAETGADVAELEVVAGCGGSRVAQVPIGRVATPIFVAPVQQ